MDDIKLALLGNKEAAKRLTETGYFKANGKYQDSREIVSSKLWEEMRRG